MDMITRVITWQEDVQLAPWVPGGHGSSQRAPLQPARQLQAPDFGSQNPPDRQNCDFDREVLGGLPYNAITWTNIIIHSLTPHNKISK